MNYYEWKANCLIEDAQKKNSIILKQEIRSNIKFLFILLTILFVYIAVFSLLLLGTYNLFSYLNSDTSILVTIVFGFLLVVAFVMFLLLLFLINIIKEFTIDIYMENKCCRFVLKERNSKT